MMNPFFTKCLTSVLLLFVLSASSTISFAQTPTDSLTLTNLKKLSMEELLEIEVTSVSMRPEKLTEVASAVQVITGEDIHRSGVTRLPEALRLASNLQVAQANSHDWAITARGFNGLPSTGGILANKLLVLIDGRSVYNPLFGGVYWDAQYAMLGDIDRIEVVSGPGGTLWGANAVNGVINVVSKPSNETQGLHVTGATGTFLNSHAEARYGFQVNQKLFGRVYGRHFDQGSTTFDEGENGKDDWYTTQGGFRMDYFPSNANTITLQGDFYNGVENKDSLTSHAIIDGQNVLARFTHFFSEESDLRVQAYFDRTWRITPGTNFFYELYTYDVDVQYRFPFGKRHSVLVGGSYRLRKDHCSQTLVPLSRNMPLYTVFVQDEITIAPERLRLTLGSKLMHNVFTGFEIQPCARLAWTLNDNHTLWASVSGAVRTPSRYDSDVIINDPEFDSEKVIAYELGYRTRPVEQLSLSIATFFNHYNDLRSLNVMPSPPPIIFANSQRAESWGVELSANFQATAWWRLRGGYTYFDKTIWATSSQVHPISEAFEGVDSRNIAMIQSIMDLPMNFQLDVIGRYYDYLPSISVVPPPIPAVPAYVTFDLRVAWQYKAFEISLVGQNLLEDEHIEASSSKIPRSIYGKIVCQF